MRSTEEKNLDLLEHQKRVIRRIQDPSLGGLVVAHGVGSGKALHNNTLVYTVKGLVAIKELRVGDWVLSDHGKPTDILAVYPQGEVDLFEVTFSDGASALACANHRWSVREPGGPWLVKTTSEILSEGREYEIPIADPLNYNDPAFGDIQQRTTSLQMLLDECGTPTPRGWIALDDYAPMDVIQRYVETLGGVLHGLRLDLSPHIEPFQQKEKLEQWKRTKRPPYRILKSIRPTARGQATCITVRCASQRFVISKGIVTLNTRTSIEASKVLNQKTHVVAPKALLANYTKEMKAWGGRPGTTLESQQLVARRGKTDDAPHGTLIVDEAHRAREPGAAIVQALKGNSASKRLLLTATPVFNHPRDLSTLVNIAAGRHVLPEDLNEFNKRYVETSKVSPSFFGRMFGVKPGFQHNLKNKEELKAILNRYVDYHEGQKIGYPSVKEETVKVTMGPHQTDIYNTIMAKAPLWVRWKVRAGLPPNKKEVESLQAFLSGARQVSNTSAGLTTRSREIESTKLETAAKNLAERMQSSPRYKGLVYSNYIESGVRPYESALKRYKIPYAKFTGKEPEAVRSQSVRDYNKGRIKALLVSSAGTEGLDLKGTRMIQILDPHFNLEKEIQIVGRGARYRSHAALPPSERDVTVQRYIARPRANWLFRLFGKKDVRGADEYIQDLAQRKNQLSQQVKDLVRSE